MTLPHLTLFMILFIMTLIEIIFVVIIDYKNKNTLSPIAIKESLDALPDGICFFDDYGQPLLINKQMNSICAELFNTEILNAKQFYHQLTMNQQYNENHIIRITPTIIIETRSHHVWDFHCNIFQIGKTQVHELIAYDISEEYSLSQELKQKNNKLTLINQRLHQYNQDIEKTTIEKELLMAKIQVHDDVGSSLLAFRSYLGQKKEIRNREDLLFIWRYTISVLKNEAMPQKQKSDWELLLKAAQAIDVDIECNGEFPCDAKKRSVIISAVHVCLTNTVRHAHGDKLYLFIETNKDYVQAEIKNNGIPPSKKIKETGGLKNLRHHVENANGQMTIESFPQFILTIRLPKGESKNENTSYDCR